MLFVSYFLYSREESPAQAIIITFIDMSGLGRYHNRHNMLYIYISSMKLVSSMKKEQVIEHYMKIRYVDDEDDELDYIYAHFPLVS